MLFNSWEFLPFCIIVFVLYFSLRLKLQNIMLLVASYFFYGCWDWRFLSLIIISTVVDFFIGKKIYSCTIDKKRKYYLFVSCFVNLFILGVFKYFNFFTESAESIIQSFGFDAKLWHFSIVLPVGISFYTFQTMSYTIDIYRKKLRPTNNFLDFSLFVAFFPQLVAGPIERASRLLPQLTQKRIITKKSLREGLWLILLGFFKKIVVANNLANFVDSTFSNNEPVSGAMALLSLYAFAFQIYGDFSGYSDIARGISKLMGIELMKNFNLPYISKNPSEFWRRWHISLSSWLRDYLYISLGGNRFGQLKTYRNLFLTMLLGGLWHGAAWTFVVWGLYHGFLLSAHRYLFIDKKIFKSESKLFAVLSQILMFHLTCLSWLLFRAKSFNQVILFLKAIFINFFFHLELAPIIFAILIYVGVLLLVEVWAKNYDDPRESILWGPVVGPAVCSIIFIFTVVMSTGVGRAFIYFQF